MSDTERLLAEIPPEPGPCSGSHSCEAEIHTHGCWADTGNCELPGEHVRPVPAEIPEQRTRVPFEFAAETLDQYRVVVDGDDDVKALVQVNLQGHVRVLRWTVRGFHPVYVSGGSWPTPGAPAIESADPTVLPDYAAHLALRALAAGNRDHVETLRSYMEDAEGDDLRQVTNLLLGIVAGEALPG